MTEFWQSLADHLSRGRRVFLALVADNTRHSPGTVGARLLVADNGDTLGTIGGGVMERDVIAWASEVLGRGEPLAEIRTLHHRKADGSGEEERSGMICAGSQTNLYRLCRPEADAETVERLASWPAAGRSGTLRISPRGMSLAAVAPDLTRPQRRLRRDGEAWLYEEELLNRRRLAILGGGHCALALARVMSSLGYDVLAFEGPQKEPAAGLAEHVPSVERVPDFRDAGGRIDHPELTWVVVVTSDFPSDVRALTGALSRPFPFLGVMGSEVKIREIRRRLREEGFSGDDLARLTAPVGLPIGSDTPEEIAISIAAQILERRNA